MNVIELLPATVNGFPVDYHREDPEIGGLVVIIWRSPARDDGFTFHAATAFDAHRILKKIEAEGKRRAAQ